MIAPKPHVFHRPKPSRLPERKAVTIALGFRCIDGIVLCTDTEMSKGDLKFKQPKISMVSPRAQWEGAEWVLLTAYSGFEGIATRVNQLLSGKIETYLKSPELADKLRAAIEEVLAQEYKNTRKEIDSLQMLFAISIHGEEPTFLRSWGKVVSEASVEYAGGGDSSVIRFLADLLCPHPQFLNTEQALMIALYMVAGAKKYVSGVGQETHAVIVRDGTVRVLVGPVVEHRERYIATLEFGIAEIMRCLFNTKLSKDNRDAALARFSDEMKNLGTYSEIRI